MGVILVAILNLLVIPILVTLIWEFFIRDHLVPHVRRLNYRVSRFLRREPSIGELMRRLSTLCQPDEKTGLLLQREQFSGLAMDGCFEIIHSHLYEGWREHDFEFLPLARVKPSPSDLVALASKYRPNPPNNGKYRLYGYVPDSSERPTLRIQLAPTDYFSTYPIQRRLFESVLQDASGASCSPFG